MRRRLLILPLSFLFLFAIRIDSYAAPLEELQNSSEYRGAVRGAKRLKLPAWADPASNYVSLFEGTNSKAKIFKLLGDDYEGLVIDGSRLTKKDEYIAATRTFRAHQAKKGFTISLVLPHPAYLHLVKEKLVLEIEALHPKPAEIMSSDPITVDTDPGELILRKDGSTVVYIPLPMEARIIATASNAKDAKSMMKVLEAMNFGEIKRLLTS